MEREAINGLSRRVEEYGKSLRARTASEPLRLSGDEINALIQTGEAAPGLGKKVYVRPEGDKLNVDFSFPLDGAIPMTEGRYLNGTAVVKLAIENGDPVVRVESVEANGKPIPDWVMKRLEEQLPLDRIKSEPDIRAMLQNIQSVDVRDEQLVITPRTR
jgi:hypothetical protein